MSGMAILCLLWSNPDSITEKRSEYVHAHTQTLSPKTEMQ